MHCVLVVAQEMFCHVSFASKLWYTDFLGVVRGLRAMVLGLSYSARCGILVLQPGIEPPSPAVQVGFLTAGPPGKSPSCFSVYRLSCFLFHFL